jgi:hypothetical protein
MRCSAAMRRAMPTASIDAVTGLVSYVGSGSAGSLELGDGQSVKRS